MSYIVLFLSVFAGVLIARYIKVGSALIPLFLAFSGAYLLSITVLHMLPEVYEGADPAIGLYILGGIVLQTVLEFFSRGAEHGHVHFHHFSKSTSWLLFMSLSIHAFLEGMPLGYTENNALLWAIVIHKIPVAIILITFLKNSGLPIKIVYLFIVLFALMSPLGNYFADASAVLQTYGREVTAVVIGFFLHIATAILFESSENHRFNIRKFTAILLGFLLAFLGSGII